MAAREACLRIKKNLRHFAVDYYGVNEDDIKFEDSLLLAGKKQIPFDEFIAIAYLNRVELFSNGFYKTPKFISM